jgi:hypothetical protein
VSRQLSITAERLARAKARRRRSHLAGLGAVVGSVGGSRARLRIQHAGAVGYAVRCLAGRASRGTARTCDERRTRHDLLRTRRRAIQPADRRSDCATAWKLADRNGERLSGRDRHRLTSLHQTRSAEGPRHARVSGAADRGQSRVGTSTASTRTRFVRIPAARGTAGRDHVSFVGRPIGQARISG